MQKDDPPLRVPDARLRHGRRPKPICLGSGLVVLDAVYDGKSDDPAFFAGGSCCNVLTILAYLGWDAYPLARLGRDPEGDRIVDDMKRWGVRTEFVERNPAIHSPRIIERVCDDTPRHRFHLKCEHGYWLPRRRVLSLKFLESNRDALPQPDIFYFDRADPATLRAAAAFKKRGSVIVFEPPRAPGGGIFTQCLELADIVKYCSRSSRRDERLEVDVPMEIRTRGSEGLIYRARFLDSPDWMEMKAIPAPRLIDAAGSGDWLTAGLVHALQYNGRKPAVSEGELQRSLRFGQALASINCGFVGARGAMYSLDRLRLLSASCGAASGNEIPRTLFTKSAVKTSVPPAGCRTCLCADQIQKAGK